MNKLLDLVDGFKGKKIIVIGDVMLDKYIWGEVSRISPEAPVQVVEARDAFPAMSWEAYQSLFRFNGNQYLVWHDRRYLIADPRVVVPVPLKGAGSPRPIPGCAPRAPRTGCRARRTPPRASPHRCREWRVPR